PTASVCTKADHQGQPARSVRHPAFQIGRQVQGSDSEPDPPKCAGEGARRDRGHQPDHPRLGELLPEGARPQAVSPVGWLDRTTTVVLHRQAMAEYSLAEVSDQTTGYRTRAGAADQSGAGYYPTLYAAKASTQESGLRENCTSRWS